MKRKRNVIRTLERESKWKNGESQIKERGKVKDGGREKNIVRGWNVRTGEHR